MKYFYYAADEFGDKFRKFETKRYAEVFINKRDGWYLIKEERIIKPIIDWNNFEEALF
jgi:hypothetical protein